MENASSSGYVTDCGRVASGGLSPVLEVALPSQAGRWPKASGPGDSGADLLHGCREPDVGSTPHSWRAAEAGLPCIGANRLTLAATRPEESGCGQALGDVLTKPSRGNCSNGLLHSADDHVWRPVLLLRHRPRPARNAQVRLRTRRTSTNLVGRKNRRSGDSNFGGILSLSQHLADSLVTTRTLSFSASWMHRPRTRMFDTIDVAEMWIPIAYCLEDSRQRSRTLSAHSSN
jgi:hypothetical protein